MVKELLGIYIHLEYIFWTSTTYRIVGGFSEYQRQTMQAKNTRRQLNVGLIPSENEIGFASRKF